MNARARIVMVMIALTVSVTSAVAQELDQYKGRLLVDVLQALQARGLRIVFSSATVTPELRVLVEPRAATVRQQLDELLAPHSLIARNGPGGTIQIVRRSAESAGSRTTSVGVIQGRVVDALTSTPLTGAVVWTDGVTRDMHTDDAGHFVLGRVNPGTRVLRASMSGYAPGSRAIHVTGGTTVTITLELSPAPATHREYVSVSQPASNRKEHGVASETSISGSQLERLYGSLADDPVRVVHVFPRVSAVDDLRSEFAVRGSPFRHVNLVVDGVSTQWLQHTAHRRGATGSLPMFSGHVVGDATLRTGAYPRRYGDRLGPQLDLTLREGSRDAVTFRGAIGGTNATFLGEGPLGRAARGSWLVAVRQSYLEWPTERPDSTRTPFGFSDGLAKVVYDVRPNQQLGLTVLGGMSTVEGEDNLPPGELGAGMNRASVANISWRSTFGSAVVLNQRAYVVKQRSLNKYQSGRESDRGANEEIAYRTDIRRPIGGGLLEGGAQLGRTTIDNVYLSADAPAIAGSSWARSGYVHFAWTVTPTLTFSPGARVTGSTLLPLHAVSRWLLGEWTFRPGWTLTGSAGTSQQLPELRHVLGELGSLDLGPERATQVDVTIEHRLTNLIRWQATVFSRKEDDILREPDVHPRLVDEVVVFPKRERYANTLQGTSRGIELVVDRQSPLGLSGWAAYSYGKTQYTDVARRETYWGDFDQRHTFTLFGVYRFSPRTSMGATFQTGSSFPIPGHFAARDGRLFIANVRNEVRLPPHARLDLRADRDFEYFGRRVTLFAEVMNALNRANVALANGFVNPSTGEAIGVTDALFRRRVSAGIVLEF